MLLAENSLGFAGSSQLSLGERQARLYKGSWWEAHGVSCREKTAFYKNQLSAKLLKFCSASVGILKPYLEHSTVMISRVTPPCILNV